MQGSKLVNTKLPHLSSAKKGFAIDCFNLHSKSVRSSIKLPLLLPLIYYVSSVLFPTLRV